MRRRRKKEGRGRGRRNGGRMMKGGQREGIKREEKGKVERKWRRGEGREEGERGIGGEEMALLTDPLLFLVADGC